MAKTQSLHEVKQGKPTSKKNSNIITDSDYFLRDKEEEAKRGYPNTIDLTPKAVETKVKPATPGK